VLIVGLHLIMHIQPVVEWLHLHWHCRS